MAADDAGDDVGQVGLGVDAVQLAGPDERGQHGPVLGATVGAGEEMVLPPEGQGSDGALDDVVVDLDLAIIQETGQAFPAGQGIADRLGELALLADDLELRLQPRLQRWSCGSRPSSRSSARRASLTEAIRYALSRWEGLTSFLDDGQIEIDNNIVERAIRPLALGRKNHLFAGSDGGAQHWAVLASLIGTCKLNGIDPQAYLTDVITRIVGGHPQSQIDELLPWAYQPRPSTLA